LDNLNAEDRQKMQQFTVLPNQLLAREDASLGRLVLDPGNPERTYHESENLHLGVDDISVKVDTDYQGLDQLASESSLKAYFTRLLSITGHKDKMGQTQVDSSLVVTYKLLNSDDKFRDMCEGANSKTRLWIQNAIKKGRRVYMVTGLKCVTDAQVQAAQRESVGASGRLNLPVDVLAGASTGKANVNVEVGIGRSKTQELGFVAAGEQIYAVQYRQLKFRNLLRRDVEGAELEDGVRWSLYLKRAANEAEEVVEVKLSSEKSGAEIYGLDKGTVGEQDVYFSERLLDDLDQPEMR
jgi:hypothetical protein